MFKTLKRLGIIFGIFCAAFCSPPAALGQNLRVDGVVFSRSGMPAPGASVAVCGQVAISAATESASTATIASTLNPAQGSTVNISGVTPTGYNGAWTVLTTSPTQFTFSESVTGLGAGTLFGTAVVISPMPCPSVVPLCTSITDNVCSKPNPVTVDSVGHYSFYVPATKLPYTLEYYGPGLTPRAQPDQTGSGIGISTHNTWTGTHGLAGLVKCASFEGVRCIDTSNTGGFSGTDFCAWVNAAYAASPSSGAPIVVFPGAYTCPSGSFITAGVNNKPLNLLCASGATSLIGASPPGIAQITFADTTHPGITITDGAGMGAGVSGCTLVGPGTGTSTIGMSVTLAVGHNFASNDISGFGVGLQLSTATNGQYINTFYNNHIHDNGQNLNYPNGGTSVENNVFIGGRFSNQTSTYSASCVNISTGVGVNFYSVSFDQCGMTITGTQAKVGIHGGHFENPNGGTATPYITVAGTANSAILEVDGVVFIEDVTSARTEFVSILGAGQFTFTGGLYQAGGVGVAAAITVNNSNAAVAVLGSTQLVGVNNAVTNTSSNSVAVLTPGRWQYTVLGESAFGLTLSVDHSYTSLLYPQYPETKTAPSALATKDRCYGDATLHGVKCSYNGAPFGLVPAQVLGPNTYRVASDFTTAANTRLQTITGLSWIFPANSAQNLHFDCYLIYVQSTAAVVVAFGIQSATIAPTNITVQGTMYTAIAPMAGVSSQLQGLTTTTATAIIAATPSVVDTAYNAELHGMIENPSNASTNTINIMVNTNTAADAVTVKRGSYCTAF